MVRGFGEKAEFVEETFSESQLAKRFGIRFYPAVFVNDVLIAKPSDFFGSDKGRYIPWREPANQEKFRADLKRMIAIALRDRRELEAQGVTDGASGAPVPVARLPKFSLTDLRGAPLRDTDLAGKPVVVEFWAEWCPPCRSTLGWLSEKHRSLGGSVEFVGIAVESEEANIRAIVDSMKLPYRVAMGSPDVTLRFGDIVSVPTLFVFDASGRTVDVFYGAPPDLHEKVARAIAVAAG